MSEKIMKKSRVLMAALLGTVMIAALTLWGCGTDGYDDPNASITTTKTSTIIDATVLKGWIAEGKLNAPFGSKDRVVVVSPSSSSDWTALAKGHIPGAVRLDTTELAEDRTEGLAKASGMMPSGTMMDGIIKRLGIDGNTTIVISLPKNSTLYYQTLVYWNLRYWGFPKERLKILNGGDDAWEVASNTLSTDAQDKYTASKYSVAKNAAIKDVVRYSIGEMISTVDSFIATPTLKDTWQMIDVRSVTQSPYITNALRLTAYTMFFTRLDAGDGITRNYVFPDKATLETRMATLAAKDGLTDAFVSPTKKTVVTCTASSSASPTFVLFDAVLNVDEGNIMMYDGSSSQWTLYSTAVLTAKYPTATAAQKEAWAFDNLLNPRAQGVLPASSATVTGTFNAPSLEFGPSLPGMTDQIENENRAYIEFIRLNSITEGSNSSSGSSQGC